MYDPDEVESATLCEVIQIMTMCVAMCSGMLHEYQRHKTDEELDENAGPDRGNWSKDLRCLEACVAALTEKSLPLVRLVPAAVSPQAIDLVAGLRRWGQSGLDMIIKVEEYEVGKIEEATVRRINLDDRELKEWAEAGEDLKWRADAILLVCGQPSYSDGKRHGSPVPQTRDPVVVPLVALDDLHDHINQVISGLEGPADFSDPYEIMLSLDEDEIQKILEQHPDLNRDDVGFQHAAVDSLDETELQRLPAEQYDAYQMVRPRLRRAIRTELEILMIHLLILNEHLARCGFEGGCASVEWSYLPAEEPLTLSRVRLSLQIAQSPPWQHRRGDHVCIEVRGTRDFPLDEEQIINLRARALESLVQWREAIGILIRNQLSRQGWDGDKEVEEELGLVSGVDPEPPPWRDACQQAYILLSKIAASQEANDIGTADQLAAELATVVDEIIGSATGCMPEYVFTNLKKWDRSLADIDGGELRNDLSMVWASRQTVRTNTPLSEEDSGEEANPEKPISADSNSLEPEVLPSPSSGKISNNVCSVALEGRHQKPMIRGKETNLLHGPEFDLIEALCKAWPRGLSKGKLDGICPDAVKKLVRLIAKNKDWRGVIIFPGGPGRGGYRVQ